MEIYTLTHTSGLPVELDSGTALTSGVLTVIIFSAPPGRRLGRPVLHSERPEEEHRVQFPCGCQQQARPWRLHRGRGGPNTVRRSVEERLDLRPPSVQNVLDLGFKKKQKQEKTNINCY